jgi:hypothetical protein
MQRPGLNQDSFVVIPLSAEEILFFVFGITHSLFCFAVFGCTEQGQYCGQG